MSLKAFDLIPVIGQLDIKITCFEACGNILYLGTEDGRVLSYNVAERTDQESGNTTYTTKAIARVQLSTKHGIVCLVAASGVGRLLVLVDHILHLLDHKTLVSESVANKIKGVSTFCLNHDPTNPDPFALEVGVGRKKCIQLLVIREDHIGVSKEVHCSDTPVALSVDGAWACMAGGGNYSIHNLDTGTHTPLFPYGPATAPSIRRIMKEEFLLDGPGGLGMFVTCDGVSIRPPINWTDEVLSFAYHHPYILTVTPHFIRIYNIVDQQVKQTHRFSGGSLVGNFDGQVYLACASSVSCLLPQPWYKQVSLLINEERVDEAVELCEQQHNQGHEKLVLNVLQRAGFQRFTQELYNNAADYFMRGQLDPRELLHLFPRVLPQSSTFVRTVPALHQIIDIEMLCGDDKHHLDRATNFTLEYLQASRSGGKSVGELEVDTGLIKLLCRQKNSKDLISFLSNIDGKLECEVDECVTELKENGMYVALEKLYTCTGNTELGIKVAVELLQQTLTDSEHYGPEHLKDVLSCCADADLVMKYSPLLLEVSSDIGVSLFTHPSQSHFKAEEVLTLLESYSDAKCTYLHYLVDELKVEGDLYPTKLALFYADKAVKLSTNLDKPESQTEFYTTKDRLHTILCTMQSYDASAVFQCIRHCTHLQREIAAVLGRCGDHEKALEMLVIDMADFRAAEEYCDNQLTRLKRQSPSGHQLPPLYVYMLKAYLKSYDSNSEASSIAPLNLLSRHGSELPLRDTIPLLPSQWSMMLTGTYFSSALSKLVHERRMLTLQRGLAKCSLNQTQALHAQMTSRTGKVELREQSVCSVCRQKFSSYQSSVREGGIVLYPNGVMAHRSCVVDLGICPLTGSAIANI